MLGGTDRLHSQLYNIVATEDSIVA